MVSRRVKTYSLDLEKPLRNITDATPDCEGARRALECAEALLNTPFAWTMRPCCPEMGPVMRQTPILTSSACVIAHEWTLSEGRACCNAGSDHCNATNGCCNRRTRSHRQKWKA